MPERTQAGYTVSSFPHADGERVESPSGRRDDFNPVGPDQPSGGVSPGVALRTRSRDTPRVPVSAEEIASNRSIDLPPVSPHWRAGSRPVEYRSFGRFDT
jgi:hypothetical protein